MKIGIDAGGTKTYGVLFDKNNIIYEVTSGMGNVLVDFNEAIKNIIVTVEKLLTFSDVSREKIELLTVGCAGSSVISESVLNTLKKQLNIENIFVKTDLEMSHIATFNNENGTLLIVGTGSAILSRYKDQFVQKGGWGHILGDEGSAYAIGKQIIKDYTLYIEDGIMPSGFEKILPKLIEKLPDRNAVIELFYRSPKDKVASFAALIEDVKDEIYGQNLIEIVVDSLVDLVIRTVNVNSKLLLALEGSVVLKNNTIRAKLLTVLENKYKKGVVLCETLSGVYAATKLERNV